MYALVINNVEYELPQQLTVGQWMGIASLDATMSNYSANVVRIVLGLDHDTVQTIPEDTIEVVMSFILMLFSKFNKPANSLETIKFDDITFGQWIDLDVYLQLGLQKHLAEIVELLYDIDNGYDAIYSQVIYGVNKYIVHRNNIYNQYKSLFGLDDDYPEEPKEKKTHPAKSWHNVLMSIADDDITKVDAVLEMPLIKVFNFMAYRKEKAIIQHNELQKIRQ